MGPRDIGSSRAGRVAIKVANAALWENGPYPYCWSLVDSTKWNASIYDILLRNYDFDSSGVLTLPDSDEQEIRDGKSTLKLVVGPNIELTLEQMQRYTLSDLMEAVNWRKGQILEFCFHVDKVPMIKYKSIRSILS